MFELDAVSLIVEPRGALQNGRDDGRPLGDAGHRIDLVERLRFLAAQLFADEAADERNLAGAADEQDPVDVLGPHAAQCQGFVDGRARLDHQRHDLLLERLPVDLLFQAQMPLRHQLGLAGDGDVGCVDSSILAFSTASMNCVL